MNTIYKWWVVSHDELEDDARILQKDHKYDEFWMDVLASEIAELYWGDSGWECSWPLVFAIKDPDGVVRQFNVSAEPSIDFHATQVKP